MEEKKKNAFDRFVNQYELSKTLRFELRPIGNTQKMLEDAGVFEEDRIRKEKYEKTKPFIDRLHREFVNDALQNVSLTDLERYLNALENWKANRKDNTAKKLLEGEEKRLRKEICGFFDGEIKMWAEKKYPNLKLKKKDIGVLFEEGVFGILKERYGNEESANTINEETGEVVSIFDDWKGFVGYFGKFFETRKNFYKDDGTGTAIATRIVDQNLKRFCDNLSDFEKIKSKIDFSEVEKNFEKSIDEVFSLEFYNGCLLQEGIDFYNKILGGDILKNGEKLKGINELINNYRQINKGERLSFLKTLDKQILSEKESFIKEIKDDKELLDILRNFYQVSDAKIELIKKLFGGFVAGKYDFEKIYISKEAFNTISRKWTNETKKFEELLYGAMKADKLAGLGYDKKEDTYKFPDFISLGYFQGALQQKSIAEEKFWKDKYYKDNGSEFGFLELAGVKWDQFLQILKFEFESLLSSEIIDEKGDKAEIGYDAFKKELEKLINKEDFSVNPESKVVIKNFADNVLWIYQMAKYFAIEKKRNWLDEYELGDFYTEPESGYLKFYENAYEEIVQGYNDLRNYLTKKPYSEEKWKLNFENPTLANGWDKNKESDNSAVILRKDGKYYLGLMKKGNNRIFDDRNADKFSENIENGKYEKVVYKYFPDQAKMFPKVCFSDKGLNFFKPSEEILEIYQNSEFKKGETFSVKKMQKFIDFYKDCLEKYEGWKCYNFKNLKSTEKYQENIGEFFRDVAKDGYKISFQNISDSYIDLKNKSGELYLFEIHNKDWNLKDGKEKTGSKNLHTLYFENLFSDENISNNFTMKLNGQAELFFRPKTEKDKLGVKKDKKGEEVINHKRYSVDKIFFHCPMTFNREKGTIFRFNNQINNFIAQNANINIIGVDRGEKHLAYYSVINQKGEILKSGSFNEINGVDYAEKLEKRAGDREQARKDWQAVEGIKDLKKGYISQVVRKLADLAIEHNAIIVLEDLNMRFKQVRGGIEKSVYQQLEKALIDKLSFLVNKEEKDSEKAGHLLRAYQLSAPFETFQKMGKQTGIIFYTQASYTSKIDPVTGWRPNLYLKYTSAEKAKNDISKFDSIVWNENNQRFEFEYDLRKFQVQKEYPKRTSWVLCSCVERFCWDRSLNNNKGGYVHYEDLTDEFLKLFSEFSIDVNKDILGQIKELDSKENAKFFKSFIFFFSLVCQIRNTQKEKEGDSNDFILSPVEPFFDSRKVESFGKNLPKNGDDNGAYNIARKGIVVLDKISKYKEKNGSCEKIGWGDLYISHTEWDNFSQKNN